LSALGPEKGHGRFSQGFGDPGLASDKAVELHTREALQDGNDLNCATSAANYTDLLVFEIDTEGVLLVY
jgi:hypothetical protein